MPSAGRARLGFGAGLSGLTEMPRAVEAASDQALAALGPGGVDLCLAFFSGAHAEKAAELSRLLVKLVAPRAMLGVSAGSVVGGATELERAPGVSLLLGRLPGVRLSTFTGEALPLLGDDTPDADELEQLAAVVHAEPDSRCTFLLADPVSAPLIRLLPALNRARRTGEDGRPAGMIFGGMASAGAKAGQNRLLVNDRVLSTGLVGLTVSGDVDVSALVSQGCRPFGPPMVVTKARHNMLLELAGRPALDVLNELIQQLDDRERRLLEGGVFIGRVINEYRDRFGRDDFLIRGLMGVDPDRSALAVADLMRTGQTVRFHVRDARTASQDLGLLLDSQRLKEPPAGAFMVTCNGRGARLFGKPNHDAAAVARAFAAPPAGESVSKGGVPIAPAPPGGGPVPLAGFFAAGEIGPVGGESFVHGHTACVALFRPRS